MSAANSIPTPIMKVTSSFVLAFLAASANAHTRVWGVWLNGEFQGDGRGIYVRSPPTDDPVKDLTSDAMACNVNNVPVPTTVQVQAGDEFTFEWYHNTRADDIIAASHHGPVQVYIAPTSSNGTGDVWVKLWSKGYANGTWGTDDVEATIGQHSIIIPEISSGEFLLRALHEADALYSQDPARGAQNYPSCTQINITSNSTTPLPPGVAFPGAYTDDTPGIHFNIYEADPSTYIAPGPNVSSISAGGFISHVGDA
ncbi:glycoside hydrolase family 61 protein [Amylostereum chailletii]|nr:glycoside hydrolase family 61 protein [Amylostereum chailletii]